ncbi:hypothetical protein [Roseobacter sp. CCS2]|uniref:hypothetical protein n=1 Tax=Roseobacter sp. CCS2 TaxID=391593 RepID=UPI0000F4025C|nr:hypothetical protein [Roseobacter sp. CCS2]EBA13116.1 hypothetical protein RCCS2_04504 [Roseobacter sp. CCS2]
MSRYPKTDFTFVLLLWAISVSVDVPIDPGGIHLSLKYLIPIISIFCGISFGSQYSKHIIVGTLPLLVGLDISQATEAGVRVSLEFGPTGLFFANLIVHKMSYSQQFRKELLSRHSIGLGLLSFLFVGIFFFVEGQFQVLRFINERQIFDWTVNGFAFDPRMLVVLISFIIGASNASRRHFLMSLAALFLFSYLSKSLVLRGVGIPDYWFQTFLVLTYSAPDFFVLAIASTALGVIYRQWTQRKILNGKNQNVALCVLAVVVCLSQVGFRAEYTVGVGSAFSTQNTEDEIAEASDLMQKPELSFESSKRSWLISDALIEQVDGPRIEFWSNFRLINGTLIAAMLFVLGLHFTAWRVVFAVFIYIAVVAVCDLFNSYFSLPLLFRFANAAGEFYCFFDRPASIIRFGSLSLTDTGSVVGPDYVFLVFGFVLSRIRAVTGAVQPLAVTRLSQLSPTRVTIQVLGLVAFAYTIHRVLNYLLLAIIVLLDLQNAL